MRGCTPSMGMNLWGGSPLSEDSTLTMLLTTITTSQWQGQSREGLSEGSRSAKRRADEQTTAWMPEVHSRADSHRVDHSRRRWLCAGSWFYAGMGKASAQRMKSNAGAIAGIGYKAEPQGRAGT